MNKYIQPPETTDDFLKRLRNLKLTKTANLITELQTINANLTLSLTNNIWYSVIKNYLRRIDAPNERLFNHWVKIADFTSRQIVKTEIVRIMTKNKILKKKQRNLSSLKNDEEFVNAVVKCILFNVLGLELL